MIPTEHELLQFLMKRELVNFSLIARHFRIKNATVSDLIMALKAKKLVDVKKFGQSKVVMVKKA